MDNNFAAKIAEPKGLVQIQKNKFNVFGTKSENRYKDLIFINSDDVEKFMYGRSGYVDQQNLVQKMDFFTIMKIKQYRVLIRLMCLFKLQRMTII